MQVLVNGKTFDFDEKQHWYYQGQQLHNHSMSAIAAGYEFSCSDIWGVGDRWNKAFVKVDDGTFIKVLFPHARQEIDLAWKELKEGHPARIDDGEMQHYQNHG